MEDIELLEQLRSEIEKGHQELLRGEGIHLKGAEALLAFIDDIKRRGRERLRARLENRGDPESA